MNWTDDRLDEFGGKVDAMQGEMRTEFKAVRSEMAEEFKAVRGEMKEEFAAMRSEMKEGSRALRSEVQAMQLGIDKRFDALHASLTTIVTTVFATTIGGFMALLAALVVTQL